jgi:hypothetical protein
LKDDPQRLGEWAFVMISTDLEFDFTANHNGNLLRDALWDASFNKPIDDETIQAIYALQKEKGTTIAPGRLGKGEDM